MKSSPAVSRAGALRAVFPRGRSLYLFAACLLTAQLHLTPVRADSKDVWAAVGGVALGASLIDNLSPKERERINNMCTADAWNHLMTPSKSVNVANLAGSIFGVNKGQNTNTDREAQKKIIVDKAEQMIANSSVPLDAYEALCKQMAGKLSESLKEEIGDTTPKGGKFALAIGAFKFFPRAGAAPDPKMADALENVVDHLSSNRPLRQQFAFVSYKAGDADEIIKKIGGDSADWLNQDMTNLQDVAVKRFHPDDLYVLTGSLIEQREGDYTLQYEITCRLAHPRSQGATAIGTEKFRMKYLFHPTRYWLTEEQDNQIKAAATIASATPAKSR